MGEDSLEEAGGGDIVLLMENEQVPADVIVLSTSNPDGLFYFETKNLDGETNLRSPQSRPGDFIDPLRGRH